MGDKQNPKASWPTGPASLVKPGLGERTLSQKEKMDDALGEQ